MSFGYQALRRSDSYIYLSSASPSAMRRLPLRRASISSFTSDLSLNAQSHGLEQGRLHGLLQRIGHRRRQRHVYRDLNSDTSEKENYMNLCDEMEPNSRHNMSSVTDKPYDEDTDEMVFKKRHHRSQTQEADSEDDPAMPIHHVSPRTGGEHSRLKEIDSPHPSDHTLPVRSTSFNAHGEYVRLKEMEEPVASNHVRRTSFSPHEECSDEEEVDHATLMRITSINVHRQYSRLKELNGTRPENGRLYNVPLHCLTRTELHA